MLKFFYGVMGSSKTAQALIQNYNCRKQRDVHVALLKPSADTRSATVSSRIGLQAACIPFSPEDDILTLPTIFPEHAICRNMIIIVDEAQFCTEAQIDQLRTLADKQDINVYCYGLRTDFQTHLFPGSKRLMEVADEIEEIPYSCSCGRPAIVNARFKNGSIQTSGKPILVGDKQYKALCHTCYIKELAELAKDASPKEDDPC